MGMNGRPIDRGEGRKFKTFEDAELRVQGLRELGIWPGIVCYKDGTYRLTYDPYRLLTEGIRSNG
jgi:hypothetical protein